MDFLVCSDISLSVLPVSSQVANSSTHQRQTCQSQLADI